MTDQQLDQVDQALLSNDLRKAEMTIVKMLRTNPATDMRAQILIRRARSRLLAARPDEALEDIQTCLALSDNLLDTPEVLALLGDIYFERFVLAELGFADRADTDKALTYYNRIIEHHRYFPRLGWVFYQRGRIFLSENRTDEAEADFKAGLQARNIPPSLHAFCHERLGYLALFDRRDPPTALTYFDEAVKVHPVGKDAGWLVHVHVLRSRAFRELGQYQPALAAAWKALDSLDPSAPDYRQALTEAHLAVGEVLALIPGREPEALEHLLQFLQTSKRPLGVDVTWSRIHETIGDLSLKLERYEQAVEAYQASLHYNPYHPWEVNVHYQIARCYYRMRAYERVVTSVNKMLKAAEADQHPVTDYRVYYVLANAHFALEKYREAALAYENAARFAPANAPELDKIKTYLRFSRELAGA